MKALGMVLLVLGLVGIAWGGISWTRDKTVVDAGPIELKKETRESIPIPPVAGVVCLVAGAALLIAKR